MYNKTNNITPMIILVQTTHLRLFGQRKQQLSEKVVEPIIHVRQLGKKKQVHLPMQLLHFLVPQTFIK
jgi:hypothetical protein